jgi:hypothetical protein
MRSRISLLLSLGAAAFIGGVQAAVAGHVARQDFRQDADPIPYINFLNDEPGGTLHPISCQTTKLEWFYSGPKGTIDLVVTNVGVSQDAPPPALSSPPAASSTPTLGPLIPAGDSITARAFDLTITLAQGFDPEVDAYNWTVNVPQGWYIIRATMASPSYTTQTVPFFVFDGPNASCNPAIGVPSPATAIPVPFPVPASASNRENVGAIVGGTLGGVAVVALLLLGWFFYGKRQAAKRAKKAAARAKYTRSWRSSRSGEEDAVEKGPQDFKLKPLQLAGHQTIDLTTLPVNK